MADNPAGRNPYVGPRPFEVGQPLFGRDREVAELRYLLTSERIVLLYSPSGAGKSSLVQAGLIPRLQQRFEVWGPIRVNHPPPAGVENRYVWSTIAGLERSDSHGQLSLIDYISQRTFERNPLIIFDQFEEVLRVDPVDLAVKRVFFEQLGEVLHNPKIWALFVLREDYLAPLDPYARLIPTHLQNRYRIDRLTREMAVESIVKPSENTPRKYAAGVVATLVENLAKVKVQQLDGSFREEIGGYVEPLQLQVVCFDLWDRMRPDDLSVDPEDIGDVDDALRSYYQKSIQKVAGGNQATERAIRDWFQERLITADGVRNQVMQDESQSGGLDNALVQRLVDTYLVRAEPRGGVTWYELAHDRLVKPVRDCNQSWADEHLSNLQKSAALWKSQDRPKGLLLEGAVLDEAKQWAQLNKASIKSIEQEMLDESEHRQEEIRRAMESVRREREQSDKIRRAGIGAGVLAVIALIAFLFSAYEWRAARNAQDLAEKAQKRAEDAERAVAGLAQSAFDSQAVAISTAPPPPISAQDPKLQGARVVYLQIRRDSPQQSAAATQMKQDLEKTGQFKVPGIEALVVGPRSLEVRYFRKVDAETAAAIAAIVKSPDPIYIDRYENSNSAKVPTHFEIWFGPAVNPGVQFTLEELLRRINANSQEERLAALAQLVDRYHSSPAAISSVLKLLEDPQASNIAAPGMINAFYFLNSADAGVWTLEQKQLATKAIASARQHFPNGAQLKQKIDVFEKTLSYQQSK